jgi:hypothetical protein
LKRYVVLGTGFMDEAMRGIGAQKIIAITTDIASLNVLASRDLVSQMTYKHILTLSCVARFFEWMYMKPQHSRAMMAGAGVERKEVFMQLLRQPISVFPKPLDLVR